jgi:toxin ParE1/3/4
VTSHRLAPAAEADLADIWDWTESNFGTEQAELYVRLIQRTIEDVAAGRRRARSAEGVRAGYRKVAAGSQMVYFRQDAGTIDVVRILHQRMDPGAHL